MKDLVEDPEHSGKQAEIASERLQLPSCIRASNYLQDQAENYDEAFEGGVV